MNCQRSNMFTQLFGLLLLTCQIISNGSYKIHPSTAFIPLMEGKMAVAVTLPEGYVSFPDEHTAYKIYRQYVTWEEARDLCIAEGGRLAIADTVDKIKHIRSTVFAVSDWISVGIRLQNSTNEWVRVDNGVALTSLPWLGFPSYADEDNCVGISLNKDRLINFSCSKSLNWYACEIDLDYILY